MMYPSRHIPLLILLLLTGISSFAQNMWHLGSKGKKYDFGADVYGIQAQAGVKPSPVIVAVIDNGVQEDHTYLKPFMWTNEREKPGNNIDDDKNGYVDDIHGWSFLGGEKGDITYEAFIATRKYYALKAKYADTNTISVEDKEKLAKATRAYEAEITQLRSQAKLADKLYKRKDNGFIKVMLKLTGSSTPEEDLIAYKEYADSMLYYNSLNTDSLRRIYVGDNPDNAEERHYGNNHLGAGDPSHGTHTAGIVAGIGRVIDSGSWLKIISIRAVPANGDERDKDIANAIRYAVDNGAKVINMSFGRYEATDYHVVEAAVKYAEEKDVLLVHSAGNDGINLTDTPAVNYPNATISEGDTATNFLHVGASGKKAKHIVASFSNYGRRDVDILAPGVDIYSSIPTDSFANMSGTSMAGPVAAGVAAIIRSYYPQLTSAQVIEAMMKTVTKTDEYTNVPGARKLEAQLWYFSRSGGVLNAAAAVRYAGYLAKRDKN